MEVRRELAFDRTYFIRLPVWFSESVERGEDFSTVSLQRTTHIVSLALYSTNSDDLLPRWTSDDVVTLSEQLYSASTSSNSVLSDFVGQNSICIQQHFEGILKSSSIKYTPPLPPIDRERGRRLNCQWHRLYYSI